MPRLSQPSIGCGCMRSSRDSILLVQRKFPPSAGSWVLPGGFVDQGERPEEAVLRLKEEAGLDGTNPQLLMVMGDPARIQGSTSSASSTKWRPLVIQSEATMHKMLVSGPFQRFSKEDLCLLAIMVKLLRLGSINQFRANELSKLLTCIRPFWKFKRIGQMQSCQELSMDFFDIIARLNRNNGYPSASNRSRNPRFASLTRVLEHPSRQPHWQR